MTRLLRIDTGDVPVMDRPLLRMLLVDADESFAGQVALWLEECASFPYHLETYTAWNEGLKRTETQPFDLILFDPGQVEELQTVVARLREAQPRTPLLVVSREPVDEWSDVAHHVGVQKNGLHGHALIAAVRRALDVKRHEDERITDQNLVHALLENATDHIYFKDTDSRFIRINRSLSRYFGLSHPDEIIGLTDYDIFHRAHAEKTRADELHIMQTGEPIVNKEELETWPDGELTWVSTTKMPLRDATGRIVGTFGISRDITETKRALSEKAHAEAREREMMERTDRLNTIGLLAAGMAHEINNPLQGMMSHLRNIKRNMEDDDGVMNSVMMLERGVESISALLQKLLALGCGEREARMETADCAQALRFVTQLTESQLARAGIRLIVEGGEASLRIAMPEKELIQVLLNLMINARDAMPDGGKLRITVRRETGTGVIRIVDTGEGMTHDVQKKIFSPFYSTKGTRGTGLGLAVAAALIQSSGGTIEVESAPGKGAAFTLRMPMER